jgi:hypothetical protein
MSGNSDDPGPRHPRARAYSHDVIRTSSTVNEEASSTSACSGITSNTVGWTYRPQSFHPGSGSQDPSSRNRRPVRRANTWGQ